MPAHDPLRGARRILVYGVTGSGKTTAARRIAEATGLPFHDVDELTWEPGWVAVSEEEQRRRAAAICAEPEWVLDTAYSTWLDIPLARVDLIVGLDYPRWFSFQRLVRRTVARNIDNRPICNGNVETWRNTFSADSILVWHFRSFANKRARLRAWMQQPDGPRVVRFGWPRQLDRWLQELSHTADVTRPGPE